VSAEKDTRLLTPETKHPQRGVEPCGPEASAFTAKMLPAGTTVKLELDVRERDQYGRILAYVYKDGKSVQEALLAEGLARVAVYPPNVKYVDEYREIEAKAKEQKKGIWADKPCAKDEDKKDDGKPDDGNKGSDDDKKGGTITPPKSGGNSGQTGGNTGGRLPKTATNHPTYALIGAAALTAGIGILAYRRRTA